MIVTEAKRLQDAGERGLEILPGVQDFLQTVSGIPISADIQLRGLPYPAWAIVTSGQSAARA
jgi:hypothetical protein